MCCVDRLKLQPVPVVQAIRSTCGCPTATFDPKTTLDLSADQLIPRPKAVITHWSEGFPV